ncbi:uncharacterized protein LOC111705127 [Eurytemora carolleeae]|uniref:uncharacterized protein LOC111705127 n=1 Tax=Eurytemora carolleeae TaxID=1294199 RepID=UPI000C7912EF|nr:uncharacterized protein LOC111705127 [Eurytemora carolleeae]|eukprot:XP_023333350.1 uncharacterized protein LOC111705127 [Eurytemora affinis]
MISQQIEGSALPLLFCKVWFNASAELYKVEQIDLLWYKEWGWNNPGRLHPHLLICPLPAFSDDRKPTAVSLVQSPDDIVTNYLPLHLFTLDSRPGREDSSIAVCVKPLSFPDTDISFLLAEWIQLQFALGADRIVIYKFSVNPATENILEEFTNKYQNRFQVVPTSLPGNLPNLPRSRNNWLKANINKKRQNEILMLNDCFLRNINTARYVTLVDIDEVIVPKQGSWLDLLQTLEILNALDSPDAFCFQHFYFFKPKNISSPFFTVYNRSDLSTPGEFSKCFHKVEKVETVHNHLPFTCLTHPDKKDCFVDFTDPVLAKLHHYRAFAILCCARMPRKIPKQREGN